MRRRSLLTLGISCLVAACAHQGDPPAAGMAWSLHQVEGEGVKLAYGQPASDNVFLMMSCAPGSGLVHVSLTTTPDAPTTVELVSAGRARSLRGQLLPGLGDGSAYLEADTRTADPALANFASTGDLTVVQDGRRMTLPVRAGEKPAVAAFVEACRFA